MAKDGKRKGARKGRKRRTGTYEPVRGTRLKQARAPEPPAVAPQSLEAQSLEPQYPESVLAAAELDDAHTGAAVDDGLRILAALEEMESLEPDFSDDPASEASVIIIERASTFEAYREDDEGASGSVDSGTARKPPGKDIHTRVIYQGPIEEAEVEIFEGPVVPPDLPEDEPETKAHRVTRKYITALTGEEDR